MNQTINVITMGSGEPLILLHGWGWHSAIWKPLLPILSKHFQLFLIDLPGFGHSPMLEGAFSLKTLSEHIFKHIPKQAHWLGWSLGGMIAWWVALYHPEKVSRLITVASSPKFVSEQNWPGVYPQTLDKFKENLLSDYHQTLKDFLDLQLRGSQHSANLLSELSHFFDESQHIPLAALLDSLELLRSIDLRQDLQRIHCPSLHIFGSHDTLVPKEIPNHLQSMLPNSRIEIIKRAGHMPFLSHPDIFMSLVLSTL